MRMVYAIDYPWTELCGQARPPAYNDKTLGLVQPRGAPKGGVGPAAASGMAGVRRVSEQDIRVGAPVSFSRKPTPEAQVKLAVVLSDVVPMSLSAGTFAVLGEKRFGGYSTRR